MVECQIVTLVVTGSSPVIYPILKLKKISIFADASAYNLYCIELKKYVNIYYINNNEFFNYTNQTIINIFEFNNFGVNKLLIDNSFNKIQIIKKLEEGKTKNLKKVFKQDYFKFYTFYETYAAIFINNEISNLTNFKYNLDKNNTTYASQLFGLATKKIIHFSISLIKSQIFLTLSKNLKNIPTWNLSLGVLLRASNFSKNARRTKTGFEFLLKFLKKKIKLLITLNYFFAFTIKGHKKLISTLIVWLTKLIPAAKMLFILWLPRAPLKPQRKKKYASIKKNLKKRLLKIK